MNGKVSSSNNDLEGSKVDGIVNRYLTEDSEENDTSSHSQPLQDKQDVCAQQVHDPNVCGQQRDELSLAQVKKWLPTQQERYYR